MTTPVADPTSQTDAPGMLEPLRHVQTDTLDVAYFEAGPSDGPAAVLLHGFPYDIHSYVDVIPHLTAPGMRVIVPHLRGHGTTRFRKLSTFRSGQQAALGADVVALLNALSVRQAVLAGFDWGARAACVVAALWPQRVRGIVSVNGYLIQNIASSLVPIAPASEAGFWYFYYFATERGRIGLTANRREVAEVIWRRNSPKWAFTGAELDRTAAAFGNPDYVDVVIHSYRHRLGLVQGDPAFDAIEYALSAIPAISVPAVTLDGQADGNFPATDGTSSAHHFRGPRLHRQVQDAGHNLPQEAPEAFASAVLDVMDRGARP